MDYYCQKQYYGSLVADLNIVIMYHLWQDKEKVKNCEDNLMRIMT